MRPKRMADSAGPSACAKPTARESGSGNWPTARAPRRIPRTLNSTGFRPRRASRSNPRSSSLRHSCPRMTHRWRSAWRRSRPGARASSTASAPARPMPTSRRPKTLASSSGTSRTSRRPSSRPGAAMRPGRATSWSSSSSCAPVRSSLTTNWRERGPMQRDEFAKRRRQLMRHMGRDAIAILPAAPVRTRNNDVEYHYRPDSDFYYLTSFAEPEAVAVLIPGRPQGEYVLFVRDRDPAREAWDGPRAGPEGAVRDYGANDAFPVGDIDEILPGLLERCSRV